MFEVDILFSPFVDDARGIAVRRTRGDGIAVRTPSMRRARASANKARFDACAFATNANVSSLQMSTVFKRVSRASSERCDVIVLFRRRVGLCHVVVVGFVEAEGG